MLVPRIGFAHLCHNLPYNQNNFKGGGREILEPAAVQAGTTSTASEQPGLLRLHSHQIIGTNHRGQDSEHNDYYGDRQHRSAARTGAGAAREGQRRGIPCLAHGTICMEKEKATTDGTPNTKYHQGAGSGQLQFFRTQDPCMIAPLFRNSVTSFGYGALRYVSCLATQIVRHVSITSEFAVAPPKCVLLSPVKYSPGSVKLLVSGKNGERLFALMDGVGISYGNTYFTNRRWFCTRGSFSRP